MSLYIILTDAKVNALENITKNREQHFLFPRNLAPNRSILPAEVLNDPLYNDEPGYHNVLETCPTEEIDNATLIQPKI